MSDDAVRDELAVEYRNKTGDAASLPDFIMGWNCCMQQSGLREENERLKETLKHDVDKIDAQYAEENAKLTAEVERLKHALKEFDDDGNWLIEGSFLDRPTKNGDGQSDWVYIGKWDPRVFAISAIDGEPLENTKPEERRPLSEFYKANPYTTILYEKNVKLLTAGRGLVDALHNYDMFFCGTIHWIAPPHRARLKEIKNKGREALEKHAALFKVGEG